MARNNMAANLNNILKTLLATAVMLLTACEPLYDPVVRQDVPTSPGSTWEKKSIVVKETAERPFTPADLSGTMPLSRLLDIALYNNPLTRVSWNAARASAYAYRVSLSPYYPTIAYSGSLNAQRNMGSSFATSGQGIVANTSTTTPTPVKPVTTDIVYALNNFSLNYLVLDFGGRDATAELALQTLYASNWQHNFTMQQVMLSVLTSYTSYIGNRALVAAFEQDLKDSEVALKATKVMRSAGLATLTDELLAQSNLETTRTNLIQAQGAEKTSFAEILINIGLPPDADITADDLPQELPVVEISGNITALLELAKKKRPDLGIAIAAIKQQEAQLAISYSSSMPILTATGDWNQIRFVAPKKPAGYNEVAFIGLDFPIFQGYYYMNQQRQLRAQVEEALANLDVQVAAISTQVVTNYYSFKSAEAALPSAQAAVEYSARAFRGYVIQYKTGTASILDMLNALTLLSNARSQLVVVRTQWAVSLANLAFSVGILEDNSGTWRKAPPKELSQLPIEDNKEEEDEQKI
jgi:outer membrane protein TolC